LENDRAGKVKKKKKEAEDMEQELLQEIASYWGTRAEGYSEVNEKELAGSQREAWLHVLEEQFPEKKKEEMKILDIGTGPGFFPMILSEAGYTVAAVDYTEEMLEKAKENLGKYTKYGLERVTLQRMDAQNLEFADETFDVVISRNLTWNLEKPEQAYQEWMRVLKPGGVLLNFDANWYGYLYDEEKKEAYEADRKKVEEQQLDDHYLCTDIDRMENIARQVPLSAMERPAWDTKVLESLGVCSIQTDSEIWKRVWSEEERLNYASTPMFLVRAEKSAEQPFQLGDVTVRRGEKYQGVSEDGLWYPAAKPGDMVTEGDPVVAYGRIVREPEYDDRKEQIVHYWEKRSENFLEQRRSELANPIAKRWMKEIEKQIPAGRRLKILDVGCGAGFFSILLAKEGHEVFGIDLTPEMIENAIQLAEEENADCCFQVMDAENPMFADETFDVVISRNLTWTLPNAEHAYGEWMRVLKTGGVLLNFDANYGKEDVADTKGLPEAHAHFKVGNEMLEECERIKSQLPISRKNRPAYDVAVLCENTAGEIRIDTSLGKRIYLEKDEFYNPAPMFSICAVKQ
jgi:ubiquinone/menaquinone biosynthesis C-methylase UbiE